MVFFSWNSVIIINHEIRHFVNGAATETSYFLKYFRKYFRRIFLVLPGFLQVENLPWNPPEKTRMSNHLQLIYLSVVFLFIHFWTNYLILFATYKTSCNHLEHSASSQISLNLNDTSPSLIPNWNMLFKLPKQRIFHNSISTGNVELNFTSISGTFVVGFAIYSPKCLEGGRV